MALFKCKACGGDIVPNEDGYTGKCEYCNTIQTLPKDKDEKISQILNRANDFRLNCDFDRAIFEYEKVLELDETEPEAHWGIFLSRYGVEYVKDTMSLAYKPTLHRISSTSVFDDVDYQATLKYASRVAAEQYKADATYIESVMKELLLLSANQDPYDIFLSYKELDDVTRQRTDDSYLAHDLYNVLTAEGYKVFFAPKSLVGVLQYEPKIYSAIISSKVMIVLGTKPQYLDGVWVKNEWSRFAEAIEHGENKVIIPVFKNMEAGQLPNRIAKYQAYDMTSLTFIEDIKKVLSQWVKKDSKIEFDKNTSAETAFIERGFLALEDREFQKADSFFENALNLNPHSSQAYFGKLMVEMGVSKQNQIVTSSKYLNEYKNFEKAVRFADQQQKTVLLQYEEKVQQTLDEQVYNKALAIINGENLSEDDYVNAAEIFNSVNRFKDAKEKEEYCYSKIDDFEKEKGFQKALILEEKCKNNYYEENLLIELIDVLKSISGWKNSDEMLEKYQKKLDKINLKRKRRKRLKKKLIKGSIIFVSITATLAALLYFVVWPVVQPIWAMNSSHKILLKEDGTVIVEGFSNDYGEDEVSDWTDIVAIYGDYDNTIGLKSDGTVVAVGSDYSLSNSKDIIAIDSDGDNIIGLKSDGTVVAVGDEVYDLQDVQKWKDITAISAGDGYIVGLKSDGTVVAKGDNYDGRCDVQDWTDIVAVSAGYNHTVGLKSDGTVVTTTDIFLGYNNVKDWTDIIAISAGNDYTVGLKSDGTVIAVGDNEYGECNVSNWTDIIAISAGYHHTIGLKSDGTVVATEYLGDLEYYGGRCDVSDWTDIVAVSAGDDYTVGLKADGKVVATEYLGDLEYYSGQCDVSDWTDMVAVSIGDDYTVGLKSDGTVVAVGRFFYGQCDVQDWTNIVDIYRAAGATYGIKADGTVVAAGDNKNGQCEVQDWTNIVDIYYYSGTTYGLKADGTVVATGDNEYEQYDVQNWTDIICIYGGFSHTIGLKADGTVVVSGVFSEDDEDYGQYNLGEWTDIVAISTDGDYTVGLKSDGTVVAVGDNEYGQCDVSEWTDIVNIYTTPYYDYGTIGLKSDGTVVCTNKDRDLSNFTDIVEILSVDPLVGLRADNTLVFSGYDWKGEYDKYKDEDIVDWIIP